MILRTFVIVGLLALLVFPAIAQTTPAPDPVQACQQLIPEGAPGLLELDPPMVNIVAPTSGEVIQGDQVAVTVETENFVLSSENHWHVWVDGQLQGMIYQPAAVLNLEPGTHQICVALSNAAHGTVSKATGIEIVVEPAAPGAPTPTVPAVVGEIINEPLVDMGQIVLLVVGGVLAGIGGWWVGQRLGKRQPS
ncbi:MAG: hypothetical protein H6672_07215 [Anaerolineaceae bacterium]|nr:hypothetical protein [Anaerolineaceae bacterium]